MGKIGVLWELDRKTGKFLNAFDLGYQTLMKVDPQTGKVIEYPMPYADNGIRDFFVDQVTEDKVADPERIALSRKVDFIAEPEITAMGKRYYVRVEIFLKDGTRMEETVEALAEAIRARTRVAA